jgi:hypothetical protein
MKFIFTIAFIAQISARILSQTNGEQKIGPAPKSQNSPICHPTNPKNTCKKENKCEKSKKKCSDDDDDNNIDLYQNFYIGTC